MLRVFGSEMTKRNQMVSISRGIAISAMVLGHATVGGAIEAWVNQFDMALFFICAGFCMKKSYYDCPVTFIFRRIKGLLVPFVCWVSVFVCLHNLFLYAGLLDSQIVWRGHVEHAYSLREIVSNVANAVLMKNSELLLGGYWFLRELLLASIFFFLLLKVYASWKPTKGYMPIVGACTIIAIIGNWVGENYPLLGIMRRTSLAVLFFVTGAEVRHVAECHSEGSFKSAKIGILFVLCIIFLLAGLSGMKMSNPNLNDVPMFIIASVSGTILVMYFAERLSRENDWFICRFHAYAGDHSFIILTFHLLAFKCLSIILVGMGMDGSVGDFPILREASLYVVLLYWVVGVVSPLGALSLVERILANLRRH